MKTVSKRWMAFLLALSFFLPLVLPFKVEAAKAPEELLRLSGDNRYETAEEVARKAVRLGADPDSITLTTGANFPDALSAGGLVLKEEGLLLMDSPATEDLDFSSHWLTAQTRLYVVGGPNSIRLPADLSVKPVARYQGADRYATSLDLLNKQFSNSEIIIYADGSNFPDSLSALNLAKKYNAPILLVDKDGDNAAGLNAKQGIAVGGRNSISDKTLNRLAASRVNGPDRYETNLETLKEALSNPKVLIVASGKNYADALASSALLSVTDDSGLLLVGDELTQAQIQYLKEQEIDRLYIVGGPKSVSETVEQDILAAIEGKSVEEYDSIQPPPPQEPADEPIVPGDDESGPGTEPETEAPKPGNADTTPPEIYGVGNKTITEGDAFDPKAGVTATDDVDGDLTNEIEISGTYNANVAGVYKITYTVRDKAGNTATATMTLTVAAKPVSDTTAPVLSGVINRTITVGDDFDPEVGVTATDDVDGDLTNEIEISGTYNVDVAGVYTIKYTVQDKAGNTATATMTLTVTAKPVSDTTAPILSGVSDKTITEGDAFDPKVGVTATDDVDGDLTSKIVISGTYNANVAGVYTIKYTVQDKAGNTATATMTLTVTAKPVSDTTAPVLSGVGDKTITEGDAFDPKAGVTATDDIDGELTNEIVISDTYDVNKEGVYKITYTVRDKAGNTATATMTLTVTAKEAEEEKPEISTPEELYGFLRDNYNNGKTENIHFTGDHSVIFKDDSFRNFFYESKKGKYHDGIWSGYRIVYTPGDYTLTLKVVHTPLQDQEVQAWAADIASEVSTESTEEQLKYFHDKIILMTDYATASVTDNKDLAVDSTVNGISIYSPYCITEQGKGVCQAYASLFKLCCDKAGIPGEYVSGVANNGSGNVNHAWNRAVIDGKTLYVDTTWDDPLGQSPDYIRYDYFLKEWSEFSDTHTLDPLYQ